MEVGIVRNVWRAGGADGQEIGATRHMGATVIRYDGIKPPMARARALHWLVRRLISLDHATKVWRNVISS
jgi:hypothetical protein